MAFHEHHYRNLQRARDHLTEVMISLGSALERMTGDDWIEATAILRDLSEDTGPRLARLRAAASERFDEHTRLADFDRMRAGAMPFPDERIVVEEPAPPPDRVTVAIDVPALHAPNAKIGAALVAQHGGIDDAMKAYQPDSAEWDHIQAYRYVTTGRRPVNWIPPIVPPPDGGSDRDDD